MASYSSCEEGREGEETERGWRRWVETIVLPDSPIHEALHSNISADDLKSSYTSECRRQRSIHYCWGKVAAFTFARLCLSNALEQHLKRGKLSQNGPFVLSDRITYADFIIYQVCHDEGVTKNGRKELN